MSIVSFEFLCFFVITLLLYYIFPAKLRWGALLISSTVFFFRISGFVLFCFFALFCAINWKMAMLVQDLECDGKRQIKKKLFVITIAGDVLVLVLFKDMSFFTDTANKISEWMGSPLYLEALKIISPVGISYFALIIIGYMADVYWGKYRAEKNFLKFALFAGYFPQLTSGPFVRYDDMWEQLFRGKSADHDVIRSGLERIIWGFFKKLVISERLAVLVNTVYGDYLTYNGCFIILAAFMFTLQLYTDFSGAMDIIIGVSACFGIELPENFDLPFCAASIEEFWRRWHITLGAWLREYVFYPLQRSELFRRLKKWCKNKWGKGYEKKFNLPLFVGMFFTWFLIGFWHGGKWNYIWGSGLYYWVLITASTLVTPVFQWLIRVLKVNTECFSWKFYQRGRTLLLFAFGLSFFRAKSLKDGILMWKAAFPITNINIFWDGSLLLFGLDRLEWRIIFFSMLVLNLAGCIKKITGKDIWYWLSEQNMIFRHFVLITLLLVIIIFGYYGPGVDASEFIYQQF